MYTMWNWEKPRLSMWYSVLQSPRASFVNPALMYIPPVAHTCHKNNRYHFIDNERELWLFYTLILRCGVRLILETRKRSSLLPEYMFYSNLTIINILWI